MHPRLAVSLLGVVATVCLVGTAPSARADQADRTAARILDSVPIPPGAEPTDLDDRVRRYSTTETPDAVLQFFREQLRTAGWREKTIGKAPANTNGLGSDEAQDTADGGPETSGDGTVGNDGSATNGGSTANQAGPIRARWRMAGATLRLRIDETVNAQQQTQAGDDPATTFGLQVRPPVK
jgi:hypothetical protein